MYSEIASDHLFSWTKFSVYVSVFENEEGDVITNQNTLHILTKKKKRETIF